MFQLIDYLLSDIMRRRKLYYTGPVNSGGFELFSNCACINGRIKKAPIALRVRNVGYKIPASVKAWLIKSTSPKFSAHSVRYP
jgi:hypothetical protein